MSPHAPSSCEERQPRRRRRGSRSAVWLGALVAAACGLSPQPILPSISGGSDLGSTNGEGEGDPGLDGDLIDGAQPSGSGGGASTGRAGEAMGGSAGEGGGEGGVATPGRSD